MPPFRVLRVAGALCFLRANPYQTDSKRAGELGRASSMCMSGSPRRFRTCCGGCRQVLERYGAEPYTWWKCNF